MKISFQKGRTVLGRNIEIEFKNMLSKENFIKLYQHFQLNDHDFLTQNNHYFDTVDGSLGGKKAALRIREKNGQFELTLKLIVEAGVLEINQPISADQAKALISENELPAGEVKDELMLLNIVPESLEYKGALQTRRAQIPFKQGQLMIDHSIYFGREDFEIEYEVDEHSLGDENDLLQLLNELNIPKVHADNKIKRFFEAKKEGKH
ncbi:CYTH domain-containing protein [Siminovitchia terrae]|uniref:CYTH domain-containing protein n=1 Tax=Siminovitchia terrae TaxID=1914933 RepID=A0A429X8Q5_SIMTE|nr:CYTH domain-containing protein [Siminovitchia terrae]RST59651.1 CYTH domain-containing protein [Siminovitchia terrae]